VRGRWGEVQLKRVVELAGMVPYADFVEQQTLSSEGRTLRPDLIVKLPGGRNIVVDAKVPFDAYVQASNAADETSRQAHLREHTRRIRDHVAQLAARAYWEPFEPTPGFVVLFVPAEPLFHAALEHDPALMEDAARQHVLLVSPASLIALLLSVAEGWRQEVVAESAREVSRRGRELYDRLGTFAGHLLKLRRGLEGAVVAYNDAVGSLERSVLPAARRFPELGIAPTKELPELEPIQQSTRTPQAPELAPRAPLGDGRDVPDAA
jgi:DNA recombination protein RmuC